MAVGPTPSWNLSRVRGTWYAQGTGSNLKAGSYKVTIPARITSVVDDSVVPAGVFDSGDLNIRAGAPSLDIMVPATDDPDILERGWKVVVEIKFADTSAVPEKYVIDVPVAGEVNLRGITPVGSSIPPMTSAIPIGAPGGFVLYDNNGDVRDAAGNLIVGGSTGTGGGPVLTASIYDATDLGRSLLKSTSQSAARTLLGAAAPVDLSPYALKSQLTTLATTAQVGLKQDTAAKGQPGGYAAVDADGDVVDAAGVKVAGGASFPLTTVAANPNVDMFGDFTTVDDGSSTATWTDRLRVFFGASRTRMVQWWNEYGEWRGMPAKASTVGWRLYAFNSTTETRSAAVPIWEVADDRTRRNTLASINHRGDMTLAGTLNGIHFGGVLNDGQAAPAGTPIGTVFLVRAPGA